MKTNHIKDLYFAIKSGEGASGRVSSVRDLTKIDLHDNYSLIIAVDSDGGIGPRPGDTVICPAYDLGRFAIRVPLMEVLASGAIPIAAWDMLTLPMDETGKEILRGIKEELAMAGLGEDFHVSGSTEDNVPTNMTGLGTCVAGLVHSQDFRPGTSQSGDLIVCFGFPKSAPEYNVSVDDPEILPSSDLLKLGKVEGIHDILPVGSHGPLFEIEQMALSAGLKYRIVQSPVHLNKSGGPSTCAVISLTEAALEHVRPLVKDPVHVVGKLYT